MRCDIRASTCTYCIIYYIRTLIYNAYTDVYRHIAYTWFITCIILGRLALLQIPTAHSDIFRIFLILQIPAVSSAMLYSKYCTVIAAYDYYDNIFYTNIVV